MRPARLISCVPADGNVIGKPDEIGLLGITREVISS